MELMYWAGAGVISVVILLMLASPAIGAKQTNEFEKSTPFECGFDPAGGGRLNFSIRFFLIAVVFLIFDVEIALLMPLMVTPVSSNYLIWGFTFTVFMLALMLGVIYEWKEGALDWKL
uniref:NADH-ubiquinone oxidoreductase chain 3 n=1 Tax=Cylisticus convexus TaxID=96835 RepID=A0A0G2T4J7_9CRUS|nr:NADH dehydrogenase subunit 3 [Cylisticus convexus]